jgi:amino acid adenylation domain-containing protein
MLAMQEWRGGELRLAGMDVEAIEGEGVTAKFDLTLSLREAGGGFGGWFEYNSDLFDAATIERMAEHFKRLLEGVVADASARVSELPLMSEEEGRLVVGGFNETAREYPREATVHGLFEHQAARTPDAVAVEYEGGKVSYRELNERAERIASRLGAEGVGLESRVGVLLERTPEMVAALLGVLKAGAAYVPLDPEYPHERLRFMLEDSGAEVLVTERRLLERVSEHGARVVLVDEWTEGEEASAPRAWVTAENLAYVIYTSGSTGKPKGVQVTHRGVVRLVRGVGYAELDERQVILQAAPPAFDASTFELWGALLNGGRCVLLDERVPTARTLAEVIGRHGVRTMWLTSALFNSVMDEDGGALRGVEQLLVGGEALSVRHVRRALSELKGTRLVNGYGPTESTTFTCCYDIGEVPEGAQTIPIGHPISNTEVYVLDGRMRPVPFGVKGELYIGGDGLARGYINRPGLTAERFVPHPFSPGPGARLYRTGDSVRVLPSGDIEFLGRLDNQVKLHGFRIEPSEIEFVLGRHPAVRETVVLLSERDGGEKLLVAYFVAARGESPSGGELRRHLRESLPEYMIPSAFVMLNSLPLTPNGKLDKRALPSPVFSASDEGYVAPRTPEEEVLAGLWSKLLRVERVSVNDSFFDLGGHSLLATQAVSRVRETFGVELPLRSMFESPTVEGLAREVVARVRGGRADVAPPIRRGERVGPLPLSFAQQRLWFLDQLEPDSPFYNLTSAVRLKGPLDVSALERAFRELASRHESLRTTFKDVGGQPAQFIAPRGAAGLSLVDLRSLDTGLRDAEVVRLVREQARLPFDLTRGPLIRCTLLRLGDEESVLTIVMHHIISDGWSSGILMRELQTLYGAYVEGREASLEELPIQYADYASWQRDRLTADALESQLSYWRVQLAGATPALELPTDRPRPPVQTYSGSSHTLSLPADLTEALRRLARVHDSTLFMLLLAAFQSLLARYTGQGDICVGTPVAGRTSPELEGLIGFFVNTLVLRTELSDDPSFVELLGRVREACLGAYAHQDVPFEKLVEELRPQRDMSRQPLFQVMLAMQEWRGGELRLAGMDVEAIEGEGVTAKFDLTLSLREAGGGFDGWFEYNSDLFDAATIERMTGHFKRLLEGVVTDASARVSELPLMGEDERRLVLEVFNDTAREYPREATLHGLFEHQAARTPDAVAVEYEDERLTYAELNERADRVARSLRRMGVGTESRVGVLLERSINLVVGLLGVLKAGAAYVPLDPEYPHERLRFMLEDSGAGVLLTQSWLLDSAPDVGARVLCIDGSEAEVDAGGAPTQSRVVSANLAYVIYTSGSTGTPKGVAITHASACVLLQWAHETFAAEHLSRVLASTSVCFDLSVFELFVPLSCGGTVVLVRDALELAADGPARSVTLVNTVPSAMTELARVGGVPPSVRVVNLAGEALKRSVVEAAYEQGVEAVYNLYGPSEDTTYSTYTLVERGAEEQPTIGRPVANTRAYILDGHGRPVPVGVTGELHLGGEGLARGYLRRPGLTAEKFVPDPFGAEPGRRLYRTGDLARHLPDGRIEFLGRRDHQHKIRGFRIELGEIEAALAGHESVAQAVAMVREDDADDKRLVAYVVAEWNQEVGASELRERLRESLPEYMIPSAFVMLDSLPLTPNGKIDRKALPAPEITGSESHYVAPRTPVEELIAGVWSEVLGVERVGINDNFFDLGGHSLLLTRVASRLREAYAVELPLRALFESPTVESLARLLSGRQGVETESPPALKRVSRAEGGRAPLSFAQQRLWLLHRLDPESPAYNITIALRLRGPLDAYALGRALGEVAARQEVLRARFVEVEGEPWQVVEEAAPFALDVEEPSGVAAKAGREEWSRLAAEDEAQRPFDLEAGPVWRARLLRLSEDEHVLLLSMHHIVSDGWSLGVLIAEVGELYRGFSEGREARLKELPVQYADYAAWQREWLKGERLERQLAYWRERLAGVPRALNLPTDRDDGGKGKSVGATRMLTISAALSEELRALGRREGVTLYMLLMAAFQTMLHGLTGEEDIVVGTPITDRRRPETEPLIGFFVNTLALRADLSGNPTFREVLRRVRAAALEAYEHQDLPFEKLVEELRGSRGAARSPLFRVYFNMLNVDLRELRLPGLEVSLLESRAGAVKFDLELLVTDTGRELNAAVGYNSALFNDATIGRVAEQFRAVLEEVVAEPDRLISDIPAPAGAAEVIDDFNNDFNDSLEVNYD